MMGLKRNLVEETVKDQRADELSAMYNMMMDQKKKNKGILMFIVSDINRKHFNCLSHKWFNNDCA